ncbi:uncharacterized protein LOC657396 isoform X2 [Tribolium castaneum]|uniref:uncharacterized protein LOC657396 isoform X2 n=1 Tax=Tribolium castaneum TaxID=7070 RepID=UPI00077DAFFA|nr:PREDICTED: uncharacterized protein LOC657396 isoform X2 [Tribolium castaneum]|eukprot:XP_015840503.1 PREDICTED: uncharacterized protein LOC657396 isoform X2 [Tribolium castaneum]
MDSTQEQVVMTPKCKTANSTTLIIERRAVNKTNEKMHVAGGEHTGIIINKETTNENGVSAPAELSLEFRVFLVSAQTGKHTQESRTLRFWFREQEGEKAAVAQDFFKELVSPQEFPRDYVGFIKKVMKLMQHNYKSITKVEVELTQLQEAQVPTRPPRPGYLQIELAPVCNSVSADENSLGNVVLLTREKVLEIIESSYPNPITIQDIAKENGWDEEEVAHHIADLQSSNIVKAMEHGAFTRQQSHDTQVIIVKQMPTMVSSKQPTIAIITAQYCEKLAVDAMIENKETFVRYTTVGESNVYTLGNIGAHRIVCTKLPSVGHTREAMTAAGNTTTRLLGTFQKVDYVFLVGVGGGVPHYTDYNKHVRLGDVVISHPVDNKDVYVYCETAKVSDKGYDFEVKHYRPNNFILQDISSQLKSSDSGDNGTVSPWAKYLKDGLNILSSQIETDFNPPSVETDKLYMTIGERDLIEVAHPVPQDKNIKSYKKPEIRRKPVITPRKTLSSRTRTIKRKILRQEGCPRIHLSTIASGRLIVRDDRLRQKFASEMGALAFDCEFDAVIESVLGNCKDSFIIIRGISDYKDGTRRKEWQPYASLAAASVMKSIICGLEPPTNV